MSGQTLIGVLNTIVIFGALALALRDLLRRPNDHWRLGRHTWRVLAPAWFVLAAAVAASAFLYPGGKGYGALLLQWAVLPAAALLTGHFFLEAGSIWVWRAGLRGRGFGWLRFPRRWREIVPLGPLLAGAAAANALNLGLYALAAQRVPIRVDPSFQAGQQAFQYAGPALAVLVFAQLLIAPFFEEPLYRHYVQSRLTCWLQRRGIHGGLAVVATSALWAMAHAGLLVPGWLKFAQIFSAGLLLGWLQRRWGVGLAIATHLSLNLGVFLCTPYLSP